MKKWQSCIFKCMPQLIFFVRIHWIISRTVNNLALISIFQAGRNNLLALVKELLLKPTVPHSMVKPLMKIHRTGKFVQEPIISKNLNFPAKKIFRHLTRKCYDERTDGFRVFLQIICLNLRQLKTHREKNWREFWIAWNIGTVTYQKNPFLKMIYLYSSNQSPAKDPRCCGNYFRIKRPYEG